MREVEKVVGAMVVRGDKPELRGEDDDDGLTIDVDGSVRLVDEPLPDVVGDNNWLVDSGLLGPTDEIEVVFAEENEVLLPCEDDSVLMLDVSLAVSRG